MRNICIIENWHNRADDIKSILNKMGVSSKVLKLYLNDKIPAINDYDGFILSGGPMSVYQANNTEYLFLNKIKHLIKNCMTEKIPTFGICLGAQLIAESLGSQIVKMAQMDAGIRKIKMIDSAENPLMLGLNTFNVFVFHRDHILNIPENCILTATSNGCKVEGFSHKSLPIHGVQFHPEVPSNKAKRILHEWSIDQQTDNGNMLLNDLDKNIGYKILTNFLKQCH